MDPVRKMWYYNNWIADQNEQAELAKNTAYLLASFWNPEAVQDILGKGNHHESSEEDFEESLQIVRGGRDQKDKSKPIRKRNRRPTVQS